MTLKYCRNFDGAVEILYSIMVYFVSSTNLVSWPRIKLCGTMEDNIMVSSSGSMNNPRTRRSEWEISNRFFLSESHKKCANKDNFFESFGPSILDTKQYDMVAKLGHLSELIN